jgi:DNA (cytosine-5)-methyltransferase 1
LDVRWIVFENVRGLLTARGPSGLPGEALELLRQTLLDAGFQTSVQLLNSADFGVPQRRVRLFIIGYRSGDEPQFPPPTHSKQGDSALLQWVSMEEAIRGLGPKSEDDVIRPSAKLHAQLSTLKPGTGVKSPGKPEATRPGGHWGYKQGAFLADTRLPARTITASSQQDWIDDPEWGIRKLSPRECARLQSFPDDWMITGSKAVQYRLIGNAVPPLLAMKLAQSLLPLKSSPRIEQKAFEELTPLPSSLRSAIEYTIRDNMRNGASRRAS